MLNDQINFFTRFSFFINNFILIPYKKKNNSSFPYKMSRNNVFKLSGNMALGSGGSIDTYSTTQLENIKSSLRLLKARQNQKRSEQNIQYQSNNGYNNGQYTANIPIRNQGRKPSNIIKPNEYYQSNAKNHIPTSYQDRQNIGITKNDRGSKLQNYNEQKIFPVRNRNENFSHKLRNEYDYNNNFNNQPSIKDLNKNQQRSGKNDAYNYNSNRPQNNQFTVPKNVSISKRNQQDFEQRKQQNSKMQPQFNDRNHSNGNGKKNDFQQIPIKIANKQKKVEVVEYDPSQLVVCSAGCGRKFNPDSIDKHQSICVKVFQKKRKEFNAQEHRILDNQHKKIVKNMEYQQKKANSKANNTKKIPKWKAESLAFRAGLKANKNQPVSAQQQKILDEAKNVGLMKCPHCGRTFNQTAGPKHINFCEQQSKKNNLRKK